MNIRKLNEELKQVLNELSPETMSSYLSKKQAQADSAMKSLKKAKSMVRTANLSKVKRLPEETTKENAQNALQELKTKMQQVDRGSDWRFDDSSDNVLTLSVRHWGDWQNPDEYEHEEDFDWQVLTDKYRKKLEDILIDVELKYGVQIIEPGSEKNWLDFDIYIEDIVDAQLLRTAKIFEKMIKNGELESIPGFKITDMRGANWNNGEYDLALFYNVPENDELYYFYISTLSRDPNLDDTAYEEDKVIFGIGSYYSPMEETEKELDFPLTDEQIKEEIKKEYDRFYYLFENVDIDKINAIKNLTYEGNDVPEIVLNNIDKFSVEELTNILQSRKNTIWRLFPSGYCYQTRYTEYDPIFEEPYPAKLALAVSKVSTVGPFDEREDITDLYNIFYREHGDLDTWGDAAEVWKDQLIKNVNGNINWIEPETLTDILNTLENEWPDYTRKLKDAIRKINPKKLLEE